MVMLSDLIRNGSLITLPNFLHDYEELDSKKESYQYQATHQPKLIQYGNRFQSTPCWETENLKDIDVACSSQDNPIYNKTHEINTKQHE